MHFVWVFFHFFEIIKIACTKLHLVENVFALESREGVGWRDIDKQMQAYH